MGRHEEEKRNLNMQRRNKALKKSHKKKGKQKTEGESERQQETKNLR